MVHYADKIEGAIVHFDVFAAGYSPEAARKIEAVSRQGAAATYNTNTDITDATRLRYLAQEADRVSKVIADNTVQVVLAVELSNGLGEFVRLDKNRKAVGSYWDVVEK